MPGLSETARDALKSIPSIDELLQQFPAENTRLPRILVLACFRRVTDSIRARIVGGEQIADVEEIVIVDVQKRIAELVRPNLQGVINGTGIILHTGLGRAPLSTSLMQGAFESVTGYAALEFDLHTGKRGERLTLVTDLLRSISGAEDALVVNNNAAAVLLMLNTLAEGKEVIVSRGQQVEIGGSFRIPDVVRKAGAILIEVGTTNRTHLRDYETPINKATGALLFVHPSNFRVRGFTKEVGLAELAGLARAKRKPLVADLGSGSILEAGVAAQAGEPSVRQVVKAGAHLVSFSGDKLLGGPQCGIIVGRSSLIQRMRRNALYRVLRCDKLTLGVLEAILRTYTDESSFRNENLAQTLLNRERSELHSLSAAIRAGLSESAREHVAVAETEVEAGSGSLPEFPLPSLALIVTHPAVKANQLAQKFRQNDPPVIGYISKGEFRIDLKAVLASQTGALTSAINRVFK